MSIPFVEPQQTAANTKSTLQTFANVDYAVSLLRFFKTGKGEYGEGDMFIGARMPNIRAVAKQFCALSLGQVQQLLNSPIHEHRMCAVIILTLQYPKASPQIKQAIYDLYLRNVKNNHINNWDLVDVTAHKIVGAHLYDRPRDILYDLARSANLWERRMSIVCTFWFVRNGDPSTSLELAEVLLPDQHDLIQKAVGWVLREVGKSVDRQLLLNFLDHHAHEMPRTALRYSIEHLPQQLRQKYMTQKTPV